MKFDLQKLIKPAFYLSVGEETGGPLFLAVFLFFVLVLVISLLFLTYTGKNVNTTKTALVNIVGWKVKFLIISSTLGIFFMFFSYQKVTSYRLSMRILYVIFLLFSIATIINLVFSVALKLNNFKIAAEKDSVKNNYLKGRRVRKNGRRI